jgi:lipopolysaccharide assembly outer membrane protein LptD (OstA)
MNWRAFVCLLALCPALLSHGQPTNETLSIKALGGSEIDLQHNTVTYTNDVVAIYGPAVLTADKLEVNQLTGDITAEGNVILQREGGLLWRGEQLSYNYKTRVIKGEIFRAGHPPYFAQGQDLVTFPTNNTYVMTNGYFTTDDHRDPNYRVRAKKLIIIPGESIEARDAIFYLGKMPVFYLPYWHKNLKRHPNNYEVTPGYRSAWGPFLLNTYNWYWDQRLHGSVNLDLRGERGIAGGPDFYWQDRKLGQGMLRYYYAHDEDPEDEEGFKTPPNDRQRLLFSHQAVIRTNLTAKAVVAYQTDPFIVRDFFESEYHDNVQPKSFLEVNQAWQNWNLNVLGQAQVNDFQETIERLPDVKVTGLRQQIAETPLYYESESSIGYFRHMFPDETNAFFPQSTNGFSAARADTYHQVVLPWTFFGWLNVIPRVGQRSTHYGEANGRGITTVEQTRSVFNTGAEVTWKASRVWQGARNDLLEVKGIRHIIEPSINYVFVPDPDARPRELPQFDSQLPSSRLLPIEFPDYNSIDSIDSQQVIRYGLRNKIQTKRENGSEDLLNWAIYTDWRITRHHGQSEFSDVYSDMDFRPRSWITFNSETRYGIKQDKFREANHTVTVQPGDDWSFSLGHRFLDKSRELGEGNNLIMSTIYYRLNENWGARISHHFEARDGVMEHQYYTLYRDFRSWTGALTFRIRQNRFEDDDYTVAFTFSLKAFPRFGIGSDSVRPMRLLGG